MLQALACIGLLLAAYWATLQVTTMTEDAYVFSMVLIFYSFLLGMRAGYVMDKNRRKIMDKKKYITMKARLWTGVMFEDAKIIDGAWFVFKDGWIRLSEALTEKKRGLYTGLRRT